ncbi:MAG: hypothetical protein PWP64_1224 [Candidatus Cloacimonadota bacterium]|nr:hypothetical protein [Candidatus Cloacimonadota bacterium]
MIDIEHLLPLVEKPSRYIDHEINAARKSFEDHPLRMLFAFPDLYELGVSHLGLKILYSIVNRLPYALADRMYLPWLDLLELLPKHNIPLFGLESRMPATAFDLLGITLQSELNYSNVLELLHQSHIPLFAHERSREDPIVLAGGPCVTNPLPLAPFIDVFFVGEAEEGIVQIAEILRDIADRAERLRALGKLPSCWVPQYKSKDVWDIELPRTVIKSRKYSGFASSENLHSPQLLSWQLATHNRYVAEIMRGCSRGCRFCHAGYFYRPVRERKPQDILNDLLQELNQSGWDEAGLISLSSSDYTCIRELMTELLKRVDTQKTHISLPSLRVDSLDDTLVDLMQSLGREGLTIAPEAGSQRLRDVINKNITEADILQGVEIALRLGWQKIKLYFMIGLPTETEADIEAIIELLQKINLLAKKRLHISVTLSPFTPKPFTSFQWCAMLDAETLLQRARRIKNSLSKAHNIRIKYHTIENSILEACLTRGDLDMARVLYTAWQHGAKFDAWRESWDYSIWEQAFASCGISEKRYLQELPLAQDLPWDFIDIGVHKEFLQREYQRSLLAQTTPDCRELCPLCGACNEHTHVVNSSFEPYAIEEPQSVPKRQKHYNIQNQYRYRISYQKVGLLRFISHLDWMRMLFRRISMLKLPTVFTQGYSPHPKVSLSPPLSVGVESYTEYFDISFFEALSPEQILAELQRNQIPDFILTKCERLVKSTPIPDFEILSLSLPAEFCAKVQSQISIFEHEPSLVFEKKTEKRRKTYDLKQIILHLELQENQLHIHKLLASPSLYDVLAAVLALSKIELYQCQILRLAFGYLTQ